MNEKQLIAWLIEESERADKDLEMATSIEDRDYHQGEYDAYQSVLSMMGTKKPCPKHNGAYDCTPFCSLCGGSQEVIA